MGLYGYVVEGIHDKDKIRSVIGDARFTVTEGTRYNNRIAREIADMLNECDRVYILTDPDEAGDRLAQMILNEYPELPRILLNPNLCKCYRGRKVKIGVEHAADEYLRDLLRVNTKKDIRRG